MITQDVLDCALAEEQTGNISGDIKPKYIILYGVDETVETLLWDFCDRTDIKESTHVIIDTDGTVHQIAPFTAKAWHAGVSYWQGYHGLNGFAIGIHICLADGVMTQASFDTLHRIIPEIVAEYNIRDIVPHRRPHTLLIDVSPFRAYVDYGNADSAGRFITTAAIEIKGGPHVHHDTLDRLEAGDGVKVLRYSADGEWAFVLYERKDHIQRQGWTYESFLKRI